MCHLVKRQQHNALTGFTTCRDYKGNQVTDAKTALRIRNLHFSNSKAASNAEEGSCHQQNIDDGIVRFK